MAATVIFLSYASTAFAFLGAMGLLLVSRTQHRYKALLLGSCIVTALWAVSVVAGQVWKGPLLTMAIVALEQARSVAWLAALAFVLLVAYRKRVDSSVSAVTAAAATIAVVYILGLAVHGIFGGGTPEYAVRLTFIARIVVAVVGLLLAENLFRNSGAEARWAVKYLCFGAGLIFVYDFYIYAEAALFGAIDAQTYGARGFIDAIAAPFIILAAARSKSWPIDLHVSRQMVFRSATLLVAGSYLLLMSMIGYSLRAFDGAWGTVTQVVFLTCAVLLLVVTLSSGKVQARARDFINRNFFSYKYDYRKEWLQFITAISDGSNGLKLPDRAIRALADIVGSTGGALWTHRDGAYHVAASFNMGSHIPVLAGDDPVVSALASAGGVVAVKEANEGREHEVTLPQWLREHNRAWLVLPLLHTNGMPGIALLGTSRGDIRLTWEDVELLKTAGRQAASYLAEAEAEQSLAQARRFEDFNRHFAFVVHDIKNLAGQMGLMVKNAERYGDNPEFQKDMLRTVGHCAMRMRTLLEQIKTRSAAQSKRNFDVSARLRQLAETWCLQIPALSAEIPETPIYLDGDPDRLETVLNHLIQNAFDAAGPEGEIGLSLALEADENEAKGADHAVIVVADNGPGMEQAFIESRLFQPLTSLKSSGFGIGAFQTRQLVREMGGRLEVDSAVGRGTRMIVRLPVRGKQGAPAAGAEVVPQLKVING